MFDRIGNKMVEALIKNNQIRADDSEIYLYCIIASLEMLFNIFITLLIGVLWGRFLKSILFLCLIIPLRSICGGYHAERSGPCFFLSILIYILSINLCDILAPEPEISLAVYALSAILLGINTPVDSVHKVLSKDDKIKQRKSYAVLIMIISVIMAVLISFEKTEYFCLIDLVMIFTLLIQAAGMIKNKINTV